MRSTPGHPSILAQRTKFFEVMERFRAGELRHASTGEVVTEEKTACAIAYRMAGITNREKQRAMRRAYELNRKA